MAQAEQGEGVRERILYVEDDEGWRKIIGRILQRKGDAVVVSSAEEAEAVLAEGGFTRVISDSLEGDWRRVYQAAEGAGIPFKILSGNPLIQREVGPLGIEVVPKGLGFDANKL